MDGGDLRAATFQNQASFPHALSLKVREPQLFFFISETSSLLSVWNGSFKKINRVEHFRANALK